MNKVVIKGNAFLKAIIESDDYNIKTADEILDLIKVHVSEQLANDMLYELLVQSFNESDNHQIKILDCGKTFICCIKLVRQYTGFSLRETKALCDKVRNGNPQIIEIGRYYSTVLSDNIDIQEIKKNFRNEGVVIE